MATVFEVLASEFLVHYFSCAHLSLCKELKIHYCLVKTIIPKFAYFTRSWISPGIVNWGFQPDNVLIKLAQTFEMGDRTASYPTIWDKFICCINNNKSLRYF